MKLKNTFLAFLMIVSLSSFLFGQDNNLNIFGYYQNNFTSWHVRLKDSDFKLDVNSFLMQQMNVFLQKNFDAEFSSFIDFEFTNSFDFKANIGDFKIPEAWLKYSPSMQFNLKAGVLIPRFNNFNEIKNRTVLLPYIYRPLAYETYFFDQFGTGEFVPTSANIQVYGDIPIGRAFFNYAVFGGNSETSVLNNNNSLFGSGQDFTNYKLVGGRLGLEYNDLQFGISATFDRKDLSNYDIGFIPRTRLGGYLNYSIDKFVLEAEYIGVMYKITQANKDTLALLPPTPEDLPSGRIMLPAPQDFNKTFWHMNLLYNIQDNLGVYVGYDYIQGKDNIFTEGGINQYNFGGVYDATNSIILKAEYTFQTFTMVNIKGVRSDILFGASVSF